MTGKELCICMQNETSTPDPNCLYCGGTGLADNIDMQPSGEVGDVYERRAFEELK